MSEQELLLTEIAEGLALDFFVRCLHLPNGVTVISEARKEAKDILAKAKREERERIINKLGSCMAGLDLEHPEYYSRQEFVVMPYKYWQALKDEK